MTQLQHPETRQTHRYPTLSPEHSQTAERLRRQLLRAEVFVPHQDIDRSQKVPRTLSLATYLPRETEQQTITAAWGLRPREVEELIGVTMAELNEFFVDQAHIVTRSGEETILTQYYGTFTNARYFVELCGGARQIPVLLRAFFAPYENAVAQADDLFQKVEDWCIQQNLLCETLEPHLNPSLSAFERALFLFMVYAYDTNTFYDSPFFSDHRKNIASLLVHGLRRNAGLGKYEVTGNTIETFLDKDAAAVNRKNAVVNGVLLGIAPFFGIVGAGAGVTALVRSVLFRRALQTYIEEVEQDKKQIEEHELLHFLSASQRKTVLGADASTVVKIGFLYLRD